MSAPAIGATRSDHAAPAPVVVKLAGALVQLFPEAPRQIEIPAASVAEIIDALDAAWPGMRDRICDSTPAIRRHMSVFVDGKRVGLDSPVAPGTEVFILTAISGG